MSHFCGLVVITPNCGMSLDECLDKYYEGIEVEEYENGIVSEFDLVQFVEHYTAKENGEDPYKVSDEHTATFASTRPDDVDAFIKENDLYNTEKRRVYHMFAYHHQEEYAEWYKESFKEDFENLDKLAEAHMSDWAEWRKEDGVWKNFSTYNPDSKWDWWTGGGRWSKCIKTKDGQRVDECLLEEIDWSPSDKVEDWHYTEKSVPYCLVVDGKWMERGEMGWWGIATNEKPKETWEEEFMASIAKLPKDSEVYNVDFHI